MGMIVKRILSVCISLMLASTTSVVAASAAQKAAPVKCVATKAVGHTPKVVKPIEKPLTKLPKTFKLVTNCGTIIITTVGKKAPWTLTEMSKVLFFLQL